MNWYTNILLKIATERFLFSWKDKEILRYRLEKVDEKIISAFNFVNHEQFVEIPLDTTLYLIDHFKKRVDKLNHFAVAEIIKIFVISSIVSLKMTQDDPLSLISYLEIMCSNSEKHLLRNLARLHLLSTKFLAPVLRVVLEHLREMELHHLHVLEFKTHLPQPYFIMSLITKYGSENDITQFRNALNSIFYHHTNDYRQFFLMNGFCMLSAALITNHPAEHYPIIHNHIFSLIKNAAGIKDLKDLLKELKKPRFDFLKTIIIRYVNNNIAHKTTAWETIMNQISRKAGLCVKQEFSRYYPTFFANPSYLHQGDMDLQLFHNNLRAKIK
ncbi:MAG: hypothetical protein A3F42_04430 [Gammaproteobacteria bacterium RIFCSPHIGHO2_12_FULL_37_34]|nr:MAG: hypothetical protein A3F42_04430 [Gammaproteobacteria bacterium RIFCSPHIGHO2_12_FULL_37_34]